MQVSNWSKIFYNLERVAKNGSKVGSYESCGKKTIVELAQSNPLFEHGLREVIFGDSAINVTGTKGMRTFPKLDGKFPDFTRFWRTMNGTMVDKRGTTKSVSFIEPQQHHGIKEICHGKNGTIIDFYDSQGNYDSEFFNKSQKTEMREFFEKLRGKSEAGTKEVSKRTEATGNALPKEIKPIQNTARQQKIATITEQLIKEGKLTREYAEIFKKLDGLEGEEFATQAYELIAKSMGFKEYPKFRFAPLPPNTDAHCGGEGITLNSTLDWTKENLVSFIRHELEHFKQNVAIVEEFGINKFIKANMSAIMRQYAETPGYCYSRFGRSWENMPKLDKYLAIKMEMDHRFPEGIKNSELALLQRASGNTEPIRDWRVRFEIEANYILTTLESDISMSKIKLEIGEFVGFKSKAEQYLLDNSCYLSPGELPEATNPALLEGGRYTIEEVKQKVQKVFDSYKNCSLEREAYKEEGIIKQMWNAFIDAIKA